MNDEKTTRKVSDNQTKVTNDASLPSPTSPDFSNLSTDVADNPYIRRPHSLKVHISPKSTPTVVGYNPRKTAKYNLRPNSKPNDNPAFRRFDALTTTH